jgi:hypothetical protein
LSRTVVAATTVLFRPRPSAWRSAASAALTMLSGRWTLWLRAKQEPTVNDGRPDSTRLKVVARGSAPALEQLVAPRNSAHPGHEALLFTVGAHCSGDGRCYLPSRSCKTRSATASDREDRNSERPSVRRPLLLAR